MGRIVVFVMGGGMVLLGCVGTFNAVNRFGSAPVEKKDVAATGVITDKTITEHRHQIGVTLDSTYRFNYSFVAADGKTYHGEYIVEKGQFDSMAKGQEIDVMYHSNQPSINGVPSLGFYISVSELPSSSPTTRLIFCSLFLVVGVGLLFVAWKFIEPSAASAKLPKENEFHKPFGAPG